MDKRINEYIHRATYNERDEHYKLDNEELIKCSIALSLASIAESLEKLAGCIVSDEHDLPAINVYDTYAEFKDSRG